MQNYKNHLRFYIPHHFIYYPVLMIFLMFSVRQAFIDPGNALIWSFLSLILLLTGWLAFMLRQHYALTLQNRIVVLEMRLRYHMLTGERLELLEDRLSFGQIAALRFAPDEELPSLLQRALQEGLSPDEIKKSIQNWLPDNSRV